MPRIVIAGTSSGAGKTTVATGLIAALAARRTSPPFKVGPDFIDPSYHALATGRPGRNLDAFLSGPELIAPLFRHGSRGADIAVIEGVMGLYDGASGRGELASHRARGQAAAGAGRARGRRRGDGALASRRSSTATARSTPT